jgi:diguanylate cyclase (GGDEF)-like protein
LHGNESQALFLLPLGALIVIALIWAAVYVKIGIDHDEAERDAFREASYLTKSYSEQLARSIDYIDQTTLSLAYYWQKTNGAVDLQEQVKRGLYPKSSSLYVILIDRNGNVISTTLEQPILSNLSDRSYFQLHRSRPDVGLYIDKPDVGRLSGRKIIRFSRRLNAADGSFDGVVAISVKPAYLASLKDESTLGADDCLSVRFADGTLVVAKLGQAVRELPTIVRGSLLFDSPEGVTRMESGRFVDDKPRVVAWQKLEKHPLVATVGLAENGYFSAYEAAAASYRILASFASACVLLAALIGMHFIKRLAWRKQQAEEVETTYRLATDGAREGFFMIRAIYDNRQTIVDFMVEDSNDRGAELVSRKRSDLIGARFSKIYTDRPFAHLMKIFCAAMETGFFEDEISVRRRDKPNAWLHRKLVRSGLGLAMTLRDISDAKAHEEMLASLVNVDPLTSLRNRHWLLTCLPKMLDDARTSNVLITLLFIDLDGFKAINDTSGHAAGDQLLQAAAQRLKSLLRPGDEAVRIGGDEFTIILHDIESREAAAQVAQRIVRAFREPFMVVDRKNTIGVSIGISTFPEDGEDAETLLQNADIAMYCAKDECKGLFRFYEREFYERLKARTDLEQQLLVAIRDDQFVLHYQPRVDAKTGELVGLEALVRWHHPERGMVPPDNFIPLAESTGLIIALGEIVIMRTCKQIAEWRRQGLAVVPVSVNVSARQFREGKIKDYLLACIAECGISPSLIEIELTESTMMGDSDAVAAEVKAINAHGVRMHVDDFGTGYSSLSLLQKLDMDVLKIDRSFTAELDKSKEGEIFFQAIVAMAKALDMRVVAEGVETPAQLHLLQALSCDEVQGYLFSKPLAADDIPAVLTKRYLLPLTLLAA